jgi:hypothetical protein
MENQDLLPDDLLKAARNLEERFQMLRVPARKATEAEWNVLLPGVRRHVPLWIQSLLSRFSLLDGVLEYRDSKNPYVRQFSFCEPDEYAHELEEGKERWEVLPTFGFVPIAYESDGSMWVTRIADGPLGEIYMLEHSGWDGGEPTKKNGLVFASSRLSLLLASMGVSEVNYYESPAGITSLIWHKEK